MVKRKMTAISIPHIHAPSLPALPLEIMTRQTAFGVKISPSVVSPSVVFPSVVFPYVVSPSVAGWVLTPLWGTSVAGWVLTPLWSTSVAGWELTPLWSTSVAGWILTPLRKSFSANTEDDADTQSKLQGEHDVAGVR